MKEPEIKTLWSNYQAAIKSKLISEVVTRERFFEIHQEFPSEAYPLPSALVAEKILGYKSIHNHLQYMQPELKRKCPICNPKAVSTRKKA